MKPSDAPAEVPTVAIAVVCPQGHPFSADVERVKAFIAAQGSWLARCPHCSIVAQITAERFEALLAARKAAGS